MINEIKEAIKTISIRDILDAFQENVNQSKYANYTVTRQLIMEDIKCQ